MFHSHFHPSKIPVHAQQSELRNERVSFWAFILTSFFMVLEIVGGFFSGSLALLADGGHKLTDAGTLLLAWAGFRLSRKASSSSKTFGYMRLEVIAGFINALVLFLLVIWVFAEAVRRLFNEQTVLSGPLFVISLAGLAFNIGVLFILSHGETKHVNIKAAMLHILSDVLGSAAAVVSAIVIRFTGWLPIDPILSMLVCVLISASAYRLMKSSLRILMEGAPSDIDLEALKKELKNMFPQIKNIADVHIWSITPSKTVATLKISLQEGNDPLYAAEQTKTFLLNKYRISHSTVEICRKAENCSLCPVRLDEEETNVGEIAPNQKKRQSNKEE